MNQSTSETNNEDQIIAALDADPTLKSLLEEQQELIERLATHTANMVNRCVDVMKNADPNHTPSPSLVPQIAHMTCEMVNNNLMVRVLDICVPDWEEQAAQALAARLMGHLSKGASEQAANGNVH